MCVYIYVHTLEEIETKCLNENVQVLLINSCRILPPLPFLTSTVLFYIVIIIVRT